MKRVRAEKARFLAGARVHVPRECTSPLPARQPRSLLHNSLCLHTRRGEPASTVPADRARAAAILMVSFARPIDVPFTDPSALKNSYRPTLLLRDLLTM